MEQEPQRLVYLERNEDILRRAAEHVARPSEELAQQPPGGGWGIGMVFEHLCTTHELYLGKIAKLLADTPEAPQPEVLKWKPSLGGGLLVRSLEAPMKLRAPGAFAPGPQPRERVVQAFIEQHEQIELFLAASQRMPWQRMRLASPVTRLLRMNLGDAFGVLVVHAERHLRQADGVAAQMEARSATS